MESGTGNLENVVPREVPETVSVAGEVVLAEAIRTDSEIDGHGFGAVPGLSAQGNKIMSKFSFKTFTSFLLALTFLALTVSGVMLFLSPPGRVAHWTNWTLLGLGKEEWGSLHILMALVFLIGSLFHLLKFNWKVFLHYLKTKSKGFQHQKELVASVCLFMLVLGGTLLQVPPFISVIALHEEIKGSWEEQSEAPPVPHMERMSMTEVASGLDLTEEQVTRELSSIGVEGVDGDRMLAEVADDAGRSPQEIYRLLQRVGSGTDSPGSGRGMGRRTLAEIAAESGVSVENAIESISEIGIQVEATDRLREIASRANMSPHELIELIKKEKE